MSAKDILGIVASALGIGAVLVTVLFFLIRALIQSDVKPALSSVATEAKNLAEALRESKENAAEERHETHRILGKLTDMVGDINGRVIRLEERSGAQKRMT